MLALHSPYTQSRSSALMSAAGMHLMLARRPPLLKWVNACGSAASGLRSYGTVG